MCEFDVNPATRALSLAAGAILLAVSYILVRRWATGPTWGCGRRGRSGSCSGHPRRPGLHRRTSRPRPPASPDPARLPRQLDPRPLDTPPPHVGALAVAEAARALPPSAQSHSQSQPDRPWAIQSRDRWLAPGPPNPGGQANGPGAEASRTLAWSATSCTPQMGIPLATPSRRVFPQRGAFAPRRHRCILSQPAAVFTQPEVQARKGRPTAGRLAAGRGNLLKASGRRDASGLPRC